VKKLSKKKQPGVGKKKRERVKNSGMPRITARYTLVPVGRMAEKGKQRCSLATLWKKPLEAEKKERGVMRAPGRGVGVVAGKGAR